MIRVLVGLETDFDHTDFFCYEISKLINRIFDRKSDLLAVIFYTRNVLPPGILIIPNAIIRYGQYDKV